jgi:hypothetical protein
MLENWQKEENLKWLKKVAQTLKEGGVWVWQSTGYMYEYVNGEFIADTEEANQALKNILPKEQKLII